MNLESPVNQRVVKIIERLISEKFGTQKALAQEMKVDNTYIGKFLGDNPRAVSKNFINKLIEYDPDLYNEIYNIDKKETKTRQELNHILPQPRPQYAAAGSINTAEGMTYAQLKRLISSNEFVKEFKVIGDSMEPELSDGMVFFGTPITSYDEIINLNAYVLETNTRGTLIKRVKFDPENRLFKCISDNKEYPTFVLYEDEVSAVYRFKAKLSFSLRDPRTVYHRLSELEEIVEVLKSKLDQLN